MIIDPASVGVAITATAGSLSLIDRAIAGIRKLRQGEKELSQQDIRSGLAELMDQLASAKLEHAG